MYIVERIPLVYISDGKIVDDERRVIEDWKKRMGRFGEIYIIDIDGVERNEPNLDLYQRIYRKKWIDSFPRCFEDVMDLVISGADKVVIRRSFDGMDRVFREVDVELYLSISNETEIGMHNWSGYILFIDDGSLKIPEDLDNIYIVARHKDFIDLDMLDDRVKGIIYPLWEMEP